MNIHQSSILFVSTILIGPFMQLLKRKFHCVWLGLNAVNESGIIDLDVSLPSYLLAFSASSDPLSFSMDFLSIF